MSRQIFAVLVTVVSLWLAQCQTAHAQGIVNADREKPLRVTFVNPDSPDSPFWQRLIAVMSAAAEDLGISLNIVHAHNVRMAYVEALMTEIESDDPPDYLVYIYLRQASAYVLAAAEQAGVKSLIINTEIPQAERATIGEPRTRFKQWIGHIHPDDRRAGEDLLTELVSLSTAKGNSFHQVTAISGSRSSAPALERDLGLHAALAEHSQIKLNQLVHVDWNGEGIDDVIVGLMQRHPNTNVVWTAGDSIALKALKTISKLPESKRRQFVIGGMDWSEKGLEAVANGDIDVSMGGHFMEGGWAMVMLYDYHHGHDFARHNTQLTTQLFPVTRDNIEQVSLLLSANDWQHINFESFSMAQQPEQSAYRFHWPAVVAALNQPD
ncbi:hypothetical protein GCM10011369_31350 [Neiella marina]|uniref:Periplasmic binding protein domain-containing protein n=1 Tax=Neiella marina TaxID=508461 RepID=A0A8J2U8L7_9GAMM|nr:ABC transporter substrate-binding protein [Neiella marina]GGA87012.1 hypothetical protein GCM10011369_31350 [Neiella marina]